MSRFLVAQFPLERGDGALAVMPCFVRVEESSLSIVVKVTFDVAPGGAEVADLAPSVPQPGFRQDEERELATHGALAPGAFAFGTVAQDADDRILYDIASGALFFDADGAGGAAAVQFAVLSGAPALTAGDFVVI